MAGSGRRTFTPGEVLTASNVMNYLMDQSVMVFAGTAARGSAIGSAVSNGMVSYLQDTNSVEVYKTVGTAIAGWESNTATQSPNVIINGAFDIWQRGTSFTSFGATNVYTADRFYAYRAGLATGMTVSRQATSFTGIQYCARVQRDSGNTSTGVLNFLCDLESVNSIPFAGKTATFSFYARAGANYSSSSSIMVTDFVTGTGIDQSLRTGYTGGVTTSTNHTLTTSWQRYSVTFNIPSNVTQIGFVFKNTPVGTAGAADYFEITGVQVEAGSTATPFRRNANSIQGELAACQRYYYRVTTASSNSFSLTTTGTAYATNGVAAQIIPPASMRIAPSSIEYANVSITDGANARVSATSVVLDNPSQFVVVINIITSGGLTQYRPYYAGPTTGNIGYIGLNAEL